MEEQQIGSDRRHDLARVERLVQEGRSQTEIETALGDRPEGLGGVWEALRRLVGAETKKAA